MIKLYYSNARTSALTEIKTAKKGVWVHVIAPSDDEIAKIAKDYKLDADLLKDATDLYEAPRVERDGSIVYVFTRYFHPNNEVINATEPLLIVYTPDITLTILRVKSAVLDPLLAMGSPVVTTQKTKTLLQILEQVNFSYRKYVTAATRKILAVRSELKRTDISNEVLLNFVEMEDDLNEFSSSLEPQAAMLRNLLSSRFIKLFDEDKDLVEDLSLGATELIELVNSRLKTIISIREAYDAIATSELNRTFRRLTSITIFLMIPTVFSGLYGMNVTLPFAEHVQAFSFVVIAIIATTVLTVFYFKKQRWL